MASVLFFPLLLLQIELTLFLCLTLLPADLFSFHFDFLPLHLQRLLGLRSDARNAHLLLRFTPPSFWIICVFFHLGPNRRAECQPIIVLENELPDFMIFWLCAKNNLTDSLPFSIRSKTPTQNGPSKYTVSLLTVPIRIPPKIIVEQRMDTP